MEMIVFLRLEVDLEQLKRGNDTEDNTKTRVRNYIADIVVNAVSRQTPITLLSSSMSVEIERKWYNIDSNT